MPQVDFARVELLDQGNAVVYLRPRSSAGVPAVLLPIWIGAHEAALISIAATSRRSERPVTHDVLQGVLQAFDLVLESAAVTALRGDVFHARLTISDPGNRRVIDCRPADAIALALREGAPLFVDDDVMRRNGVVEGA